MVKQNSSNLPYRFYGRRKGHKIGSKQQKIMSELLPKLRISRPTETDIIYNDLFASDINETWLEIGFGGGEHLLHQAKTNSNVGIIGCEPFSNGVAKLVSSIAETKVSNIRIHDGDARDILPKLPNSSISKIFILYPEPWPKKKHYKRRFVNKDNLRQIQRVLTTGGKLLIASDIPNYIYWSLLHVHLNGGFKWEAKSNSDWKTPPKNWFTTRYERKAIAANRKPCYLSFVKL